MRPAGDVVRLFGLNLADHVEANLGQRLCFGARLLLTVFCYIRNSQLPQQRDVLCRVKFRHRQQLWHWTVIRGGEASNLSAGALQTGP